RTDFAQSETDFKFKIGIEKRNTLFKLSPERTQERIDFLNDSIAEWQKASDALYNVVKTMKASCIGAGAILTFKNFISNYGGKSIARQEVMTGSGGWNEICTGLVSEGQYDSMDNCFLDRSSVIEGEVDALYGIMKSQDEKIRKIEEVNMQEGKGLAQDYVDRDRFIEDYSEQVRETLNSLSEEEKKNLDLEDIDEILTLDGLKNGQYTEKQLKEIELYSLYLKSNNGDDFAEKRLSSVLSDIKVNAKKYLEENTFEEETGMEGNSVVDSFDKIVEMKEIQVVNRAQFKDTRYSNMEITENSGGIVPSPTHYSYAIKDSSTGNKYVIIYDADGVVKQTYEIVNEGGVEKLQISKGDGGKVEDNPFDLYFKKYDKASYENTYKASYGSPSVLLRYYEISPFKGFPSVVPFDLKNGWYAGVKTPQTSYDASRVVKSFWLCNVAENGIEEFQLEGFGDDICQSFNLATGQEYTNFPGLSRDESYNLAVRAGNAIETAQKAYDDGITTVSIDRQKIKVGEPSIQTSALQCTDFMSATDCSLLFNVCDPVVCPSSRCNLGGNYPVQNVIQSGIIGSIALCYPNAKWNGGDVYIPVCLTGIYAGLDSWISIQKSYRDCLQTSLDTGETVGICDEINSIYVCEFFWKQALPIINSALPKLLGIITGQNKKGGGEYKGMSSALETAEDSIDYFKQYYAAESYRAFKVRSTEEVGTEICGTFASLTYPDGGSFLDNLIEPDSPVQFMAKFDEISLTTVTNPPTSQYKVYYHVYAGKDSGAYYTVYLRGSGSSYYQDTSQRRIVKSGYISKGDYASETVDFTSPSGYNELCVVVNGQEECGFKEVSTSFAINYVEDMYLSQQATETNITTEEECKSGTSSLYSLLNLNIQSAANNLIDPALYSQGIIRICSTDDPGVGTDARAGMENARWKQVGYCGNNRIGCWIDTKSVRDVIKTMSIEESALGEVGEGYLDYLSEEYLSAENFNSKIEEIKKETSDTERIELINSIFDKVFFNNQKAQLFFWRGKAYSNIAIPQYNLLFAEKERIDALNEEKKRKEAEVAGGSEGETGDDGESGTAEEGGDDGDDGKSDYMSIFNEWYVSPVFEFEDGTRIANLCYKFFSGEWHWIADCEYVGLGLPWVRVDNVSEYTGPGSTDRSREFIISLQEKSYLEGLKLFIERTIKNKKEGFIFWPDLVTDSVEMSHESLFKVDFSLLSVSDLYYRYSNENWWWSPDEDNWMRVSTTIVSGGKHDGEKPNLENIYLINSLESGSSDFYDGAAIIFNVDADATSADVGDVGGGAGGGGGGSWGSEETIDSCTTLKECQRVLGEKLTAIVSEVKKERNDIDYSSIRDQTRAMSFECLVLQVAWIESRVQHCEDTQYENNPLYCEGEPSYLRSGDSGSSVGIMQINTASHPKAIGEGVFYFEENVRYGANFLIDNFKKYEDKTKKYNCGYGEEYTGWAAALRAYNGWNTDCSKGDVYYVENVVAAKDSNLFKRIFPECVQESVGGGGGENW
ncbi:MAG: hypothetical protein KKE23_02760, partial [Nanoarchaeota archaeon]|nr:hypothetical protein [Nanoarchaeota archaeon]